MQEAIISTAVVKFTIIIGGEAICDQPLLRLLSANGGSFHIT